MKTIQLDQPRALCCSAALLFACASAADRELVHVDGEIFESVVRSQLPDTAGRREGVTASLRFDARPVGDNADLAGDRPPRLEVGDVGDSVSDDAHRVVIDQRMDILKSIGVEEGGPFNYPECGGSRTRKPRDSIELLPPSKCPSSILRYVTVGLPYRGAAQVLNKVRPPGTQPPDTTGEQWTVLVTESTVGPGGQQWRQYVTLFRRDPLSGRLGLAERFLLSWAE